MLAPVSYDVAHSAQTILDDIIKIKSTTSDLDVYACDTTALTDYVADFLKDKTGAEIHETPRYEYPKGSNKFHKGVVAVWRPETPGNHKPLAFSAHVDTVPALGFWGVHNPFVARQEGEKIIGRGALDMKGALASLMASLESMHRNKELQRLQRPVVLMLSSCEEVGLLGAKDLCDKVKELALTPDEVVVIESTDGYIGIGGKGMRQKTLTFTNNAPPPTQDPYKHYLTFEISAASGHSSLQSGGLADPATVTQKLQTYIQTLREKGRKAELCSVDYGVADNIVGGIARIVVGYEADAADPTGERLFRQVEKEFKGLFGVENRSNIILRGMTFVANTVLKWENQVRGLDMGKVKINVKRPAAHEQAHAFYPTLTHENGHWQAHSAIEHAVAVAARIRSLSGTGGAAAHYAIPALGKTSISVPILKGDATRAELCYDMRYPQEACQGDAQRGIESIDSLSGQVEEYARSVPSIGVEISGKFEQPPFRTALPDDKRLQPYLDLGKQTGFLKFRTKATVLPYGSDGNVIAQEIPDALILTMAHGGFKQMPHGEEEHLTLPQIKGNIDLFSAIIKARAVDKAQDKQRGQAL